MAKNHTTEVANMRKAVITKMLGGRCAVCGMPYTDATAHRFDFHHIIPNGTSWKGNCPAKYIMTPHTIEEFEVEVGNWIPVCNNCHRDIHYTGAVPKRLMPEVVKTLIHAFFSELKFRKVV
jgi:predicted HNH restriction endonuclease